MPEGSIIVAICRDALGIKVLEDTLKIIDVDCHDRGAAAIQ